MPPFVGLAALVLAQSPAPTLGKTEAQILAMGRKPWNAFYTTKQGDSTVARSGAEASYGDALAARNDRLLKGARSPLRAALQAYEEDAQAVGYAITGGGTTWNVEAASLYADAEETLHAVLSHARRGPRVRVSAARAAVERLRRTLGRLDRHSQDSVEGHEEMRKLDGRFRSLVARAADLDRKGSDAVLDFCRATADGVAKMAGP